MPVRLVIPSIDEYQISDVMLNKDDFRREM